MKVKCNKPDKNKNSKITIDIIDTGMGISEENVQTLFERFEQVDGSSTREPVSYTQLDVDKRQVLPLLQNLH